MKKLKKTFSDLQACDEVYYFNIVEQKAAVLTVKSVNQYNMSSDHPLTVATFIDNGQIDDPVVDLDSNKSIMEYFDLDESYYATETFFMDKDDFIGYIEDMKNNLVKILDSFNQ